MPTLSRPHLQSISREIHTTRHTSLRPHASSRTKIGRRCPLSPSCPGHAQVETHRPATIGRQSLAAHCRPSPNCNRHSPLAGRSLERRQPNPAPPPEPLQTAAACATLANRQWRILRKRGGKCGEAVVSSLGREEPQLGASVTATSLPKSLSHRAQSRETCHVASAFCGMRRGCLRSLS
ncbi:hypothetical protein BU16DRAFT_530853 [Lophium mytilinum]|uniref:Uncharacterized protein n=1 Tax=Lophium mytilinum TaxID=390894 RepID=A0A6A6QFU0_9PEZI|nr:hypothetical protein BU16DRAFT_530853 [Lophium mytilinum]